MKIINEFDLDASAEETGTRAQFARRYGRDMGIALAGSDLVLLNPERSQVWTAHLAPLLKDSGQRVVAWRATAIAGGCLVEAAEGLTNAAFVQLQLLIKAAGLAGVNRLTIPAASIGGASRLTYADALNQTFSLVRQIIPDLERAGVMLCLPVAQQGFLVSPPELRDLIDRMGSSWVGADVMSAPRCDRAAWHDWLTTLGPRVGVVDDGFLEMADCDAESSEWPGDPAPVLVERMTNAVIVCRD
jgi:hypothetical protein